MGSETMRALEESQKDKEGEKDRKLIKEIM